MKMMLYLMLVLSSCKSAEIVDALDAKHFVRIGGAKGSRTEVFEIKMSNNSKIKIKFLIIGNTEVPLSQKIDSENLILTGIVFPEEPTVQDNYEAEGTANLDFENAYLIYEDLSTNQLNRMKIKFSSIQQTVPSDAQLPE